MLRLKLQVLHHCNEFTGPDGVLVEEVKYLLHQFRKALCCWELAAATMLLTLLPSLL